MRPLLWSKPWETLDNTMDFSPERLRNRIDATIDFVEVYRDHQDKDWVIDQMILILAGVITPIPMRERRLNDYYARPK